MNTSTSIRFYYIYRIIYTFHIAGRCWRYQESVFSVPRRNTFLTVPKGVPSRVHVQWNQRRVKANGSVLINSDRENDICLPSRFLIWTFSCKFIITHTPPPLFIAAVNSGVVPHWAGPSCLQGRIKTVQSIQVQKCSFLNCKYIYIYLSLRHCQLEFFIL